MLPLPSGFRRSTSVHNSDLDSACDWLEASVLFHGDSISLTDIIDALCDAQIYDDQDFAREFLSEVSGWLSERAKTMPHYPVRFQNGRFETLGSWKDYPEYTFLLFLSIFLSYPQWTEAASISANLRGELFEKLCTLTLQTICYGWMVESVGASGSNATSLDRLITRMCLALHENPVPEDVRNPPRPGGQNRSRRARAGSRTAGNDGGLDIWCFYPFPDKRGGYPTVFAQCASGEDWRRKLNTPNLREWRSYILFPSDPLRAITIPFFLDHEEFRDWNRKFGGLLIDRPRVYAPLTPKQDTALSARLVATIDTAISKAPQI